VRSKLSIKQTLFSVFVVFVVCGLFSAIVLMLYVRRFAPSELSGNPEHWGQFGDYVGGTLNPVFAMLNLLALIYLTFKIRELEEDREENAGLAERRQNAVKLLDTVQSTHFYIAISAPVWEVVIKWKYWRNTNEKPSTEGDDYKWQVVSGFVQFSDKYKSGIQDPSTFEQKGHNVIRFGDHFHPPDFKAGDHRPAYVQSVLSEHQALTTWLEYWGNVATMIKLDLVDRITARALLADWYFYWLEFAFVFRHVVNDLHTLSISNSNGQITWPKPHWIEELEYLEGVFYPETNTDELSNYYRSSKNLWKSQADDIVGRLKAMWIKLNSSPATVPDAGQESAADGGGT
jgi:hypothetical protein